MINIKVLGDPFMISDTELQQGFQREYPNDLGHLTRGTREEFLYDWEARIVYEKFIGQRWENIQADLLRECFDIAAILNVRAFHYFFPAFIKQSQLDVEKTSLLVDFLINMLADSGVLWPESLKEVEAKALKENPEISEALDSIDEKNLSAWRQERWKLFTERQWALIQKWINWIDQDERWEVDRGVLQQALNNAAKWRARKVVAH